MKHDAANAMLSRPKATKVAAHYGHGMASAHCGICVHFRAPHDCTKVQGDVAPGGWCLFFKKAAK
jgi:hypothetical protein